MCRGPLREEAPPLQPTTNPLWTGYMVLRAPDDRQWLLGFHKGDWDAFSDLLSLPPTGVRTWLYNAGFYVRKVSTEREVRYQWMSQGFAWPPHWHTGTS